jgi:hypothetical protein
MSSMISKEKKKRRRRTWVVEICGDSQTVL